MNFDPEKVMGYQPWLDAGIPDRIVTWDEWNALLALYRETCTTSCSTVCVRSPQRRTLRPWGNVYVATASEQEAS